MSELRQLTLGDCPPPRKTLRERAEEWIDANPDIMEVFHSFAMQAVSKGRRIGAKAIAERVRWEFHFGTAEPPKICNSFVAYIARRLVRDNPRLADLMECRVTPSADLPFRKPQASPRVDPLTDELLDQ